MASLTLGKVFAVFTAIALIGISTTIVTFGAQSNSQAIRSSGTVTTVNVGVYWDTGCTDVATELIWGSITPGSSKTYTLYIKNEGSVSQRLSLTTQNWSPDVAGNYISLTWNREGNTISPNSVNTAILTLSVSTSITESTTDITDFSFNTIITGTA